MRLTMVAFGLVCLAIAARAHAQGFEFGPRLSVSMPTGQAGVSADPGINADVTATFMETAIVGFGMEFGYHRWPGSSATNEAFDALLSSFSGATITGSQLNLSAFQATWHLKVVPPVGGSVMPWIHIGGGIYRVYTNLKLPVDQLMAAGVEVQNGSSSSYEDKFGFMGRVGFDVKSSAKTKTGLDLSYHLLLWKDTSTGENFTVFTIGVHMVR